MKKIIFYGAFDRYNYGDNLMPIFLNMFIEKYRSEIFHDYEIVYCSISESDLSHYECLPSSVITKEIDSAENGSVIVVVGGEVLCATNSTLAMHVLNVSDTTFKILNKTRLYFNKFFSLVSDRFYSTPWEYPYIPKIEIDKIKVVYNTIGGGLSNLSLNNKEEVKHRLNSSCYLSVRDTRTLKSLQDSGINNAMLYPDSVFAMNDLITDEQLRLKVSDKILNLSDSEDYIVFQAAPNKIGCDFDTLVAGLLKIQIKTGKKIFLLPIGYAAGHDDRDLLSKINNSEKLNTFFFDDLNVWEILFIIKYSSLFIGTSLHGVITAMSYSIPHFGLNENVIKLDFFLKDWSVEPFNKCYSINSLAEMDFEFDSKLHELKVMSENITEKVLENNNNIFDKIIGKVKFD